MIAYFVGVWPGDKAGHYCRTPDGVRVRASGRAPATPWAEQYSPLGDLPSTRVAWPECYDASPWSTYSRPETPQPEGVARVVQRDGWTLVSLWDRSADGRPGSHASIAFEGASPDALAEARRLFPAVFARIEHHLGRAVVLDAGGSR